MSIVLHTLIEFETLTPETFILHFERNGFEFTPGQYVVLRDPETGEGREYSIYNSIHENKLSFLIKEVSEGDFSRFLRHLTVGSKLFIEGPRGFFILDEEVMKGHPVLFLASGTGISPFHSFVGSFPGLNYKLLHGVHFANEAYGKKTFHSNRYCLCTSRDESGDYSGRLTYYLKENRTDPATICYLCGNSDMIEEATVILESQGVLAENIRSEVYF